MEIKKARPTLEEITKRIGSDTPFAYVRWGDGRILSLRDTYPGEPDDHANFPLLRELMRKAAAMQDPNWLAGMHVGVEEEPGMRRGTFGRTKRESDLETIVAEHFPPTEKFYSAVPFHYCALFDSDPVFAFLDSLKKKRVAIVGGPHLKPITRLIKHAYFVEAPTTNAFEDRHAIVNHLNFIAPEVALFSVGSLSMALQLWDFQEGKLIKTVDTGSFLDLMLGRGGRQYIRDNPYEVNAFLNELEKRYA